MTRYICKKCEFVVLGGEHASTLIAHLLDKHNYVPKDFFNEYRIDFEK